MTIAERGHQESAVEVDLLDIAAFGGGSPRRLAQCLDGTADDQHRVGGLICVPVQIVPLRKTVATIVVTLRGITTTYGDRHPSDHCVAPNRGCETHGPLRTLDRRHRQRNRRSDRRVHVVRAGSRHAVRGRHPHRRPRAHPLPEPRRRQHRRCRHRLPGTQRPHLPTLCRLFDDLEVATQETDMSMRCATTTAGWSTPAPAASAASSRPGPR